MGHEEKRNGIKPVPSDPLKYLNEEQIDTYRLMLKFGWRMKFIRRQPLQRAVCVMTDPKMTALAVLEDSGFLNRQPDIPLRSTENQVKEYFPTGGFYS